MATKTYDPKRVNVLVGGAPIAEFASDTFVEINFTTDRYSMVSGIDGTITRSKSNDYSATVTLTLQQGSPSNAILSALEQADRLVPGGQVFAFGIVDLNGSTEAFSPEAWVARPPDAAFGAESGTRVWTIHCSSLTTIEAGFVVQGL